MKSNRSVAKALKSGMTILRSHRGQSLIQVLVAAAIMGVLLMTFVSMIASQHRETRAMEEKLAVADIQQQLTRVFADGTLCTTILTPPFSGSNPITFTVPAGGATPTNPVSKSLAFTSIPISPTSLITPLVTAGTALVPQSRPLLSRPPSPNTFQLTNIVGSSNGTNGTFKASFQVNFDYTKLIRTLRSASTQITLLTTGGVTGLQTVTGCAGTTSSSLAPTILSVPGTFTVTVPPGATGAIVEIWGGGGGGGGVGSVGNGSASGGGGGGYAHKFISGLAAGQTISATVGAGGLAGGIGGNGGAGGGSGFGSYASAGGGGGGSTNGLGAGGSGGAASGGDVNIGGGYGSTGVTLTLNAAGGAGGGSPRGGQGGGGAIGIASGGVQPGGGGGGSGSSTINPGTSGAPGMIAIYWH